MSQELESSAAIVISDLTPGGQQSQSGAPFVPIRHATFNHDCSTVGCIPEEDRDCNVVDVQQDADTTHIGENHNVVLENKEKNSHNIFSSLVAGAMAGAIAKSTIAPFDRTKISFQTTNQRYTYKGALHYMQNSYQRYGLLSLWRGNSAAMARIVPYAAIQFAAHEQWKRVLGLDKSNKHNKATRFLAGSLAGVTSQFLTYPLDLGRARMAVTPRDTYRSLSQMFVVMVRRDGFFSMYRGLCPTMLGVIPYAGTSFGIFESLKAHRLVRHAITSKSTTDGRASQRTLQSNLDSYAESTYLPSGELPQGTDITTVERLMFGGVAGLVGQTTSYPLDIARRRMQTASINGNCSAYRTTIGTLLKVYREEGIVRGLYKGLSMNWVKGPISTGLSFTLFEYFHKHVEELLVQEADDPLPGLASRPQL